MQSNCTITQVASEYGVGGVFSCQATITTYLFFFFPLLCSLKNEPPSLLFSSRITDTPPPPPLRVCLASCWGMFSFCLPFMKDNQHRLTMKYL